MNPGSRKINDTQIADLRERRTQGESLRALARRFDYSVEGVRYLLHGTGGDPKPEATELLIGRTFHRLTIIGPAPRSHDGERQVLCRCTCGNEKVARLSSLKNDGTRSCGCLAQDVMTQKHARWLTYQGRTKPLRQWCRELGLKRVTVVARLRYGWSVEEALETPIYGKYGGIDENGQRTHKSQRILDEWSAIGTIAELLMGYHSGQVAKRRGVARGTIEAVWYRRTWRELFEEEV